MGLLAFELGLLQGQSIDSEASSQELCWCRHSSESQVLLDCSTVTIKAFTATPFPSFNQLSDQKRRSLPWPSLTAILLNQILLNLLSKHLNISPCSPFLWHHASSSHCPISPKSYFRLFWHFLDLGLSSFASHHSDFSSTGPPWPHSLMLPLPRHQTRFFYFLNCTWPNLKPSCLFGYLYYTRMYTPWE